MDVGEAAGRSCRGNEEGGESTAVPCGTQGISSNDASERNNVASARLIFFVAMSQGAIGECAAKAS